VLFSIKVFPLSKLNFSRKIICLSLTLLPYKRYSILNSIKTGCKNECFKKLSNQTHKLLPSQSTMNTTITKQIIKSNLSAAEMSTAFNLALAQKKLITEDDTALIFYDLHFLKERINHLQQLFPSNTLHAVAIKANPLTAILKKLNELGVGLEAASLPELYLAAAAGFSPASIVFDSPCKTKKEIEYALKLGAHINADSFDELDRIAAMLRTTHSSSTIGVRVNPQTGTGNILSTSVTGSISKFGIPLNDHAEKLKAYYLKYEWLKSIHVHIGSQGCPVPLIIQGIRKILDFSLAVNADLKKQHSKNKIEIIDIGGGLPVSYHADKTPVSLEDYYDLLTEHCKELFTGEFKLITEFGRYIHANTGWVASKAEYVKKENNYNIIMTHTGADLFLRECYNPKDWHHDISVVDKQGKLKDTATKHSYIIAGPLCFAGDIIARDILLPEVTAGDYILIHDAGAYTLSMWSRYNSRQMPKVIGYNMEANHFEVLKERERKEDLLDFWS
jgi:diaminopimelate decarboxylase